MYCVCEWRKNEITTFELCRFSCKSNIVHLTLFSLIVSALQNIFYYFLFSSLLLAQHFITHNLFAIPISISRVISLFSTNLRFSRSKEDETCFIILYCLLFYLYFILALIFWNIYNNNSTLRRTKKLLSFGFNADEFHFLYTI